MEILLLFGKSKTREGKHNSPLLKCGLHMVTSSKEYSTEREKKSKFTMEKTDRYYLSQVLKININVINHTDSIYL